MHINFLTISIMPFDMPHKRWCIDKTLVDICEIQIQMAYCKAGLLFSWETKNKKWIGCFYLCLWTGSPINLCRQETPKRVLWQTVKTQMKCRIMRHFIWVCTVCLDKLNIQRKKYNNSLEIITCENSINTKDYLDLIVWSFIENSIGMKSDNIEQTYQEIGYDISPLWCIWSSLL